MGKKMKKKARSGHIDKRPVNPSSKDTISSVSSVLQQSSTNNETPKDGVVVAIEKRICPHIDKGVILEKVSEKLKSSEPLRCEDCREGVVDRKAGKGKGKQGKKNCGGESKAVWVCLGCGHFSCGGVGFPTTGQSHAVRHARQHHHPLAVQFQNPRLRWCFQCNTIIPIEKAEDGGETKDPLCDVMKLIKGISQTPAIDVEDIWFATGSVTSGISAVTSASTDHDAISGYMARGLMNLGNTCFFNSVMQNLLAMHKLRDYFCKYEESHGPLTMSLKKLFMDTNPEAGLRNVINPKSFFGCVCSKAPQFRGYQQHDSHELLRCLLDAWCTEELNARKQKKSSLEECKSSQTDPTFVDSIFGGQLSSTVSCLECCHTSTVYEPFLDISLPVPTKKPPSRKPQPVSRSKKPNPPPKRSARIRAKVSNNSTVSSDQCASKQSTRIKSFSQVQSKEHAVDEKSSATYDCASLEISKTISPTNEKGCDLQKNLMDQNSDSKPGKEEVSEFLIPTNDTTSLDFLSPEALLNEKDLATDVCNSSVNHVVDKEDGAQKSTLDSSNDVMPSGTFDAINSNDLTWMDFCEPGQLSDGDGMASQINLVSDPETENVAQNFVLNSTSGDCVPFSGSNVDDEVPLQAQDFAIILLPYEENTPSEIFMGEGEGPSPVIGCDNQISEFDGFGGLFDEPETEVATLQSSEEKTVQTGIIVGQSSESDHEVDNSDLPVSVERCLSYFIKPELLSKDEHAWKCENCSKLVYEQKMKLEKAVPIPKSGTAINGCKETNARVGFSLSEKQHVSTESGSLCNGTVVEDIPHSNGAVQLSFDAEVNSKTNDMTETSEEPSKSGTEDGKHEKEESDYNPSESSCSNDHLLPQSHNSDTTEPENVQGVDDSTQLLESTSLAAGSQSKRSEDEERDSANVKVKRDATKKILINRAPPILTIHLKRFYQDARGRLNKLKGHIGFRDSIDIRPYIDPRCNKRDDYKYRLLGVVEHSGSMRGGHYVAYVRGGKKSSQIVENGGGDFKWYHASDAHVHEVKLEEVLRCEAYILFYEKI